MCVWWTCVNTPACVCMCACRHICVSMSVETRSWGPYLFFTLCGLHVYLGCVSWGARVCACIHTCLWSLWRSEVQNEFLPYGLLFYFWVRVSCQSLPILPFPYSQLGPGNTSLCLMTFEITSDCHTCLDFMWLLDTWTLDCICMSSTLTLKTAPW